jgi:hypothetical protein
MKLTAREKKALAERDYLLRHWRRWHRELVADALAGPHADLVKQVLEILSRMTLSSPERLEFVQAQGWATVDADTRALLLHQIDCRITALRERAGLSPFDDALPHQKTNGFLVIQRLMTRTTPGELGK